MEPSSSNSTCVTVTPIMQEIINEQAQGLIEVIPDTVRMITGELVITSISWPTVDAIQQALLDLYCVTATEQIARAALRILSTDTDEIIDEQVSRCEYSQQWCAVRQLLVMEIMPRYFS